MYRDLIGKPERIEAGGKLWWVQTFCKWDGTVKSVNLYDENGDFISEFSSMEDAIDFARKVREIS